MNKKIIGAIFICTASLMWGLDGVVLTPSLHNLQVPLVVFIFHLLPFTIYNFILKGEIKQIKSFQSRDFILFTLLALTGGALGTIAIVKALFLVNFNKLSIVILLQKLQPVFAIILASILLREKIRSSFIIWSSVAVSASYLLTFGFSFPELTNSDNLPEAMLWALVAAFAFGSATVLSKMLVNKWEYKTVIYYRFLFTVIVMALIITFTSGWGYFADITSSNIMTFLMIMGITTVATILYYIGLNRIKAITSTICEMMLPLAAIIFDYIFHGNVLTTIQWISALILLTSIFKITLNQARQEN